MSGTTGDARLGRPGCRERDLPVPVVERPRSAVDRPDSADGPPGPVSPKG